MTTFIKNLISNFSSNGLESGKTSRNVNDYKEANYFNYYRILENKQKNETIARGCSGLVSANSTYNNNKFKLNEFSIDSTVNDTCVSSVWKQNYTNDSDTSVEASYRIPLSPLSTVSSFVIEYQDKVLVGKVKEKSRAKEIYADAIASGGQAFLAESSDDGYFSFTIGNLPPKTSVTVNITIISELGTHLSSLHYCLHRYMFPASPFKFNLNVNIELTTDIKSVHFDYTGGNGTHDIKQLSSKKNYKVKFSTETGITSNIVLVIQQDDLDKPQSFIEYNKKDNTYGLALNFYPKFESLDKDDINQKGEFIFILDCSGSMSGTSIQRAKRALEIIIRSLGEQHKLNIYCFGSSFNKAFPSSVHYNDETLAQVDAYVSKISANLGGTELLPPIRDVLSSSVNDPEYPRQVFILTDGAVSQRDQLIDYVAKEAGTTRLFTYGIGSGVDVELVVGLSKACKGYYELIRDNANMEAQVMKLLSVAFEPTIYNISFDWGELSKHCQVTQAPSTVRPIFNNERMMVYALLDNVNSPPITGPITVTMNCEGPTGSKLSYPVVLDFNEKTVQDDGSNLVHTLAGFKHIKDLEEIERKASNESQKDKIVQLGKKYNVVSKHTSFIVTAESDEPTLDTMKSVDILKPEQQQNVVVPPQPPHPPIQNTFHSFNINFNSAPPPCPGGAPPNSRSAPPPPQMMMKGGPPPAPPSPSSMSNSSFAPPPPPMGGMSFDQQCKQSVPMGISQLHSASQPMKRSMSSSKSSQSQSFSSAPVPSNDPLILLLKLQKANGSFTKSSITQFKLDMDKCPKELESVEDVWVTLLVIAYITKTFSNQKSQFELSLQKSSKWVKQQLTKLNLDAPTSFDKFLKIATSSI